jgi:hypothetical protein
MPIGSTASGIAILQFASDIERVREMSTITFVKI